MKLAVLLAVAATLATARDTATVEGVVVNSVTGATHWTSSIREPWRKRCAFVA